MSRLKLVKKPIPKDASDVAESARPQSSQHKLIVTAQSVFCSFCGMLLSDFLHTAEARHQHEQRCKLLFQDESADIAGIDDISGNAIKSESVSQPRPRRFGFEDESTIRMSSSESDSQSDSGDSFSDNSDTDEPVESHGDDEVTVQNIDSEQHVVLDEVSPLAVKKPKLEHSPHAVVDMLDMLCDELDHEESVVCAICNADLGSLPETARVEHANQCLDRSAATIIPHSTSSVSIQELLSCASCARDLSKLPFTQRVQHVKKCTTASTRTVTSVAAPSLIQTQATEVTTFAPRPKSTITDFFGAPASVKKQTPMSPNSVEVTTRWRQLLTGPAKKPDVVPKIVPSAFGSGPRKAAKSNSTSKAIIQSMSKPANKPATAHSSGQSSNRGDHLDKPIDRPPPFFKFIEGTNFVVDGFRYSKRAQSTHFFLTHWHADHYGGLSSKWNFGTIYCSPVTARLMLLAFPGLASRARTIPFNTPTEVTDDRNNTVQVTLLDANHCPGAAVLLFRVRGRTIVHCGDMRYHASMPTWPGWSELAPPPASSALVGGGSVDLVYLDTTYADPKHDFPVQEESCAFVSETIAQALAEDERSAPLPDIGKMLTGAALPSKRKTLFLIGTYQIGKEKVLVKVATDCALKVYANPQKFKMLKATDLPDVWTADEASTCVRIVPIFTLTFKSMAQTLDEARRKYGYQRVIAFRPTGWVGGIARASHDQGRLMLYGVPYSEHSSYPELRALLTYLRPKRIIPTVGNSDGPKTKAIVSLFADLLPGDSSLMNGISDSTKSSTTMIPAVLRPAVPFSAPKVQPIQLS